MVRPTVAEYDAPDRHRLAPLFEPYRYDRVHIDSVLEGYSGRAYADTALEPTVARLHSGAFTMLGGDPNAPGVAALIRLAPMSYVTPQTAVYVGGGRYETMVIDG